MGIGTYHSRSKVIKKDVSHIGLHDYYGISGSELDTYYKKNKVICCNVNAFQNDYCSGITVCNIRECKKHNTDELDNVTYIYNDRGQFIRRFTWPHLMSGRNRVDQYSFEKDKSGILDDVLCEIGISGCQYKNIKISRYGVAANTQPFQG